MVRKQRSPVRVYLLTMTQVTKCNNVFHKHFMNTIPDVCIEKNACLPQHTRVIQTLKYQEEWSVAKKKQDITLDSLDAQMKTAYFIVQKNFPLSSFPDLIELQQSNGAPTLQMGTSSHHETMTDFIKCISSSLDSDMKQKIEKSSFIGLMTDESVDIAILKKLVIYIQFIFEGKSKVCFASMVDVPDGKAATISAALFNFLQQNNIPTSKLLGFASDGAAVMMGKNNGVGVILKRHNPLIIHIHCYAHRLALAVSQAAANVTCVKSFQDTVNSNYWFFTNSPVRYNNLRAIYDILENEKFVRLKQPHAVRWLSLDQAVSAILQCWPALVVALKGEANDGNSTANGLLRKIETYNFIALTCMLNDILPLFTRMSKRFQRENLDFATASNALETVRATLTTMAQDVNNSNNSLPTLGNLDRILDEQPEGEDKKYRDTSVTYLNQKTNFSNIKGNYEPCGDSRMLNILSVCKEWNY